MSHTSNAVYPILWAVPHGFPLSHSRRVGIPYSWKRRWNTGFTSSKVSFFNASEQRQNRLQSSNTFNGWQRTPFSMRKWPLKSACHISFGDSISKRLWWAAARLASLVMRWLRWKMLLNVRALGRPWQPSFSIILRILTAPSAGYLWRIWTMLASISSVTRLAWLCGARLWLESESPSR